MDNIIHIRKATKEDCEVIAALAKKTFSETYSEISTNAAIQEYIERKISPLNLR
jgi:hypothetical protein